MHRRNGSAGKTPAVASSAEPNPFRLPRSNSSGNTASSAQPSRSSRQRPKSDDDGDLVPNIGELRLHDGSNSSADRRSSQFVFCRPVHIRSEASPLSSESERQVNFRGFYYLGTILLVVTHLRLVLENLLKYGVLLDFSLTQSDLDIAGGLRQAWPVLSTYAALGAFCGAILLLERLALRRAVSDSALLLLQIGTLLAILLLPMLLLQTVPSTGVVAGVLLMFVAVVLFMKLLSYVLVNHDYRQALRSGISLTVDPQQAEAEYRQHEPQQQHHHHQETTTTTTAAAAATSASHHADDNFAPPTTPEPLLSYPHNLTLPNLVYFLSAPTLCYQLNFPRTRRIRKLWLLGKIAQLVFFCVLIRFIVEQYALPTVQHSREPLERLDWLRVFERVLKLSLPNLYIWLLCFYSFFHLWLNITSELLRFGDRVFYKDWWNSTSLTYYWQTWNIPVHHWAQAVVYRPLHDKFRFSKGASAAVVFFISAVFHELLVSVPMRKLRFWAFLGMMGQVPLIAMTRRYSNRTTPSSTAWFGNVVFWCSFCILGQPLLVLLYSAGMI